MSKPRMGASRRVGIGLLASALFVFGIALAPNAGATADVTVIRYAGTDRYGTAQDIATDPSFAGATTAIVARGDKFPDALAASSIAGTKAAAPIILTEQNVYRPEAKAALAALGVDDVIIVGGTAAVSQSVEDAIKADGYNVTRLAGTDRYGTAADIAGDTTGGDVGGLNTAVIAAADLVNGVDNNFVDALAGGPVSYSETLPLLLVTKDNVPAVTKSTLESLDIEQVIILGGTVRVPASVETELETITGNPAIRLAGNDRFLTAIEIAKFETGTLGWVLDEIIAATAFNFPDALAAGPLGGEHEAPILLTNVDSCNADTVAYVTANSSTIATIYVVGGTLAVSQAAEDCMEAAAETAPTGAASVTSRPELQSSSIISTVTAGNPNAGTLVRYCFDEPVSNTGGNSPVSTLFYVYNSGGLADTGSGTAVVESADSKCVAVLMAAILTTSAASALTVATVDFGAVRGLQHGTGTPAIADENPEGDAPLGTTQTTSFQPGITQAPDVTTVTNFRSNAAEPNVSTQVDFTFDEVAYHVTLAPAGYVLINKNGVDKVTCTYQSGDGTTTHTVVCPGVNLASADYPRAYVEELTVTDSTTGAAGNQNALQAADVAASGNTDTPDLVSATLNLAATTGTGPVDRITYVFDEVVTISTPTDFQAYTAAGAPSIAWAACAATATSGACNQTLSGDGLQVAVDFADGTLAQVVGASIEDGAVIEGSGGLNRPNLEDEVGVANSGTSGITAGRTNGPDLIGVTVVANKDAFGNVTGYNGVYAFDEDLAAASTPDPAKLFLYTADGTKLTCAAGSTAPVSSTAGRTNLAVCLSYAPATLTAVGSTVLGTVDDGAVTAKDGAPSNPEGAERATQA